jgi:hypothetical protein
MATTACARNRQAPAAAPPPAPYEQSVVVADAERFFGRGAQGLADVLNRVFSEQGDPDAYIRGQEGGGAAGLGLRYGRGTLYMRDGTQTDVFWRGPSLGIDLGGSAAKVFMLIYDLPSRDALYQRFGGVEGSLYFVGGVGVTYNRSGATTLAPVRLGVGWRQGINVGYLQLSPERSWIPF